ncbi:MAG: hypothetical protein JXA99_00990 [Candidatus Lokiarchaeota archaeon]|nr:hypothetical protein [Candidatus Lokiarchaeota archaeon]
MDLIEKKKCTQCKNEISIYLRRHSGHFLCYNCLKNSLEKIIYNTISKFNMLNPKDKIIVEFSGDKNSVALLYNLVKIQKRTYNSNPLIALSIEEGFDAYNDKKIQATAEFCRNHKIRHEIVNYKEVLGKNMEKIVDKMNSIKSKNIIFDFYPILRERILIYVALKLEGTVLAINHNLTDLAANYLADFLYNNPNLNENYYLYQNKVFNDKYIKIILPLMRIPHEEIEIYLKSLNLEYYEPESPFLNNSSILKAKVYDFINNLKKKSPEIEFNLLNGFLELLEIINRKKKTNELKCKTCGYPANNNQKCNYCKIIDMID